MSFPVTRYSVVLGATSRDPDARRRAFASLVEAYWKPVYKYVRPKWQESPDREWARSVFGLAVDRLRAHYASAGRDKLPRVRAV